MACAPQAWAAGAVLLLFQACLGLEIDAPKRTLRLHKPRLPTAVDWIELTDLAVRDATASIVLERHQGSVSAHVLRREGTLRIIVEQ